MKQVLILAAVCFLFAQAANTQTWNGVNNHFRATNVTDITAGHDTVYIVDGTALKKYIPNTGSWSTINTISNPGAVESQQNNSFILYSGTGGLIEYSTDAGQNWSTTSLYSDNTIIPGCIHATKA